MSDYTPMTHDEIERAEAAPRLKTYDELEQQLTAANARVEALESIKEAAREAVDAVRFQKPEHERAAIEALAALLEQDKEIGN